MRQDGKNNNLQLYKKFPFAKKPADHFHFKKTITTIRYLGLHLLCIAFHL